MTKNIEEQIESYLKDKEYETEYLVASTALGNAFTKYKEADKVYTARDGKSIVREYILDDGDVLTITG